MFEEWHVALFTVCAIVLYIDWQLFNSEQRNFTFSQSVYQTINLQNTEKKVQPLNTQEA